MEIWYYNEASNVVHKSVLSEAQICEDTAKSGAPFGYSIYFFTTPQEMTA
jgi:hypothetical protein